MSYSTFENFKGEPAKIRWFDNLSGEGMVRLSNGKCVYFHYSSVEGSGADRWITFPNSGHDVECEVEILEDSTFTQVSKLRSPHTINQPRKR